MLQMPSLETPRLLIRPFGLEDLSDVHRLLDIELGDADLGAEPKETLAERAEGLQWTVLNYRQLAELHQPPYGDRAVILRATNQLIGSCGFVPCLNAFEQLPSFAANGIPRGPGRYSPAFGLFYAIAPDSQRQGYGTEAAQALVDYAFQQLHLKRLVAATTYDNLASIGVMRKLGMRVEKNPYRDPPWLQVVGVLEHNS